MGSASQSAGAVQSRLVPMHLASPDKAVSLFLKPAEQLVLEGCTLLQPSPDILFHACSTVASAEPQLQLGFQDTSDMHWLPVQVP